MWGSNKHANRLNLGIDQFEIKEGVLKFRSLKGQAFNVELKDISVVTLAPASSHWFGMTLQIVGHGVILASVEMPTKFAEQAVEFIQLKVAQRA